MFRILLFVSLIAGLHCDLLFLYRQVQSGRQIKYVQMEPEPEADQRNVIEPIIMVEDRNTVLKYCYHPTLLRHIAINQTIQTGRCSIARCNVPPFDIDEFFCKFDSVINYSTGCFYGAVDYSKNFPACCERPYVCV